MTGGGTGGHLFPGIAVAEAIGRRFADSQVLFVGTERQIDAKALAGKDFQVTSISCSGLKGKSLLSRLQTLIRLPISLLQAIRVIRDFKPNLVLGVGGYVTGPVVAAGRLLGIATCIHEQNSVPGLANRQLGRLVDRIFISIPGSERYFPAKKTVLTGNPVRREILALRQPVAETSENICLLVLGGSQGAHRVNTLVVGALARLGKDLPENFMVIHQTGAADEEMVRKAYAEAGIKARVAAFFDDMAEVYGEADLVVSRAGATTLAEITVLGKPALLIPYPFAADDHQEKNARCLVEGGGAKMFLEQDLDEDIVAREIATLLNDSGRRAAMAENMGGMAIPQATETIVAECVSLLGERGRRAAQDCV